MGEWISVLDKDTAENILTLKMDSPETLNQTSVKPVVC